MSSINTRHFLDLHPPIPSFFTILLLLFFLRQPVFPLMSTALSSQSAQLRLRTCRKISFRKRCLRMIKQQKTRFYILGRCISMLLCWQDRDIHD
ncbi:hypothetical protein SDJN03_19150, partial [Cucurbita argyrosperma subsp. sororia]